MSNNVCFGQATSAATLVFVSPAVPAFIEYKVNLEGEPGVAHKRNSNTKVGNAVYDVPRHHTSPGKATGGEGGRGAGAVDRVHDVDSPHTSTDNWHLLQCPR